jgi:hypothetical protein
LNPCFKDTCSHGDHVRPAFMLLLPKVVTASYSFQNTKTKTVLTQHLTLSSDCPHCDPSPSLSPSLSPLLSDQIAHIGIVDDADDLKYHWGRERLAAANRRLAENEVDGQGVASDAGAVEGQASGGSKRQGLPKSPEV